MDMKTVKAALCGFGLMMGVMGGCGGSDSAELDDTVAPGGHTWIIQTQPTDAVEVGAAKQTAKKGDAIVLHGRIGGMREPISEGVGQFVIVDMAIKTCDQLHGDTCPTPWDYCCEPRESLAANNATVQIVNQSGRTIEVDLNEAGLSPQDEVYVIGVVGDRPNEGVLTVKASGIYKVEG